MASNPRPKVKPLHPKLTDENTRFYVDYSWWARSNRDIRTYLLTRLDIDEVNLDTDVDKVDLVDPNTGEVHQVDGFQYVIQTYFTQLPEDFTSRTSLVDAVFSVLLANANQPMTAAEIAERIKRPVDLVLKTIGGATIHQGIRPFLDDED